MPDLKIVEARSSRDRMHTVVKYQRSGLKNTPIEGKLVLEGPPFNYYNYQGDVKYGHIPVDISREVYEAVKGQ